MEAFFIVTAVKTSNVTLSQYIPPNCLTKETVSISETVCFLEIANYRAFDKAEIPSINNWHAPWSESFSVQLHNIRL
jgi:hypothetical protein